MKVFALGATAALLAGCVSAPGNHRPPAAPGNAPVATDESPDIRSCGTTQLKLERAGNDAGMGHRAFAFRYTNISDSPCNLGGYPQVQALNDTDKVMTDINVMPATHAYLVPDKVARIQPLVPDASLWFVVTWSVIPHGNQPCPGMAALRIAPPRSDATPALASTPDAPATDTDEPQASTPTSATIAGTVLPQVSSVCDGLRVLPLRAAPPQA